MPQPPTRRQPLRAARTLRVVACIAAASLSATGCTGRTAQEDRSTLSIFAASSLADVFRELERVFEEEHIDTDVEISFAGSQILRVQIEQGASADVFVSANEAHMRALEDGGFVRDPRVLAMTDLVVIVPADNPAGIDHFDELDRASRVVIGTEYVPIGIYTRTVLDNASARFGAPFVERVRKRVASMEANVRVVRAKVEVGEADAALVYRTDAQASEHVRAIPIPDDINVQARFSIAMTTSTNQEEKAGRFLDFLRTRAARDVFAAFGFVGEM